MKTSQLIPLLLLAAGFALVAQENPAFVAWMKGMNTVTDALKQMNPKTGENAVRSAERLGGVYEEMIGFWRQRNAADAVRWSEQGKALALELATAAYAGDDAKATAAFTALGTTCSQCHEAHREKIAEDKYRIK